MDSRSGDILTLTQEEIRKNQRLAHNLSEVNEEDMTDKQRKSKSVSLRDHSSKLGKQLTQRRNDPCFCGSGIKYKKCCLYK